MNPDDLKPGMSLYFDTRLPSPSDVIEPGEFLRAQDCSGAIVPTPPDDWEKIKQHTPQKTRADNEVSCAFSAAYLPYQDGRINCYEGNAAVLSGDFSGCLMALYRVSNQRRVAHVPTSNSIANDCVGEFRDLFSECSTLTGEAKQQHSKATHRFVQYFKPFTDAVDGAAQFTIIADLMKSGLISDPSSLSVFGLVSTPGDGCYAVWTVKPKVQPASGEFRHILKVEARAPVKDFKDLVSKKNRLTSGVALI